MPRSTITEPTLVRIPADPGGPSADNALPWLIDVDVFETAIANTNWDTITIQTNTLLNGYKGSTGAQNASIEFDVVLAKGTWTIEFLYNTASDNGIYTVQLDGVSVGTIDGYAASAAFNALSSITGISVALSAKKRLKLLMATKNASSGNYYGRIVHIQLRRTA